MDAFPLLERPASSNIRDQDKKKQFLKQFGQNAHHALPCSCGSLNNMGIQLQDMAYTLHI
ncbi:hypothetical protein T4B_293 [Trichinella pseudospiralis]|uniref:Uncharacterized protein n=1 Tax=Trichinella pseudospiralis TaxID=6337 RepID=A0A0V1IM39_TRIPS|nr:hypothetical protein T4B_293 [Trichinella pseudospiralis]